MFKGFIHVIEEDFPRMYSLSWRKKTCSLVFEISQDAIQIVDSEKYLYPIQIKKEEFNFNDFENDLSSGYYGFNNCFKSKKTTNGIELIFDFVELKNKESIYNFYACAATLNILFMKLQAIPEKKIKDDFPQFIILETVCCKYKSGGHGANIHGELNKDVIEFLIDHNKTKGKNLKSSLSAMLSIAKKIDGKNPWKDLYWAEARDGGFLSMTCPGNACGLNTNHGYISKKSYGSELICHNVDEISQQLVLLSALAALSDEVKKYYLKKSE